MGPHPQPSRPLALGIYSAMKELLTPRDDLWTTTLDLGNDMPQRVNPSADERRGTDGSGPMLLRGVTSGRPEWGNT